MEDVYEMWMAGKQGITCMLLISDNNDIKAK